MTRSWGCRPVLLQSPHPVREAVLVFLLCLCGSSLHPFPPSSQKADLNEVHHPGVRLRAVGGRQQLGLEGGLSRGWEICSTTHVPSLLGSGLGSGCLSPQPQLTPRPFSEIWKHGLRILLGTWSPYRQETEAQRARKLQIWDSNPNRSQSPRSQPRALAATLKNSIFLRMGN